MMSRKRPDETRSRTRKPAAPARSARAPRRRSLRAHALAGSLIVNPTVEISEFYQRERAEHDQKHHRQRCRIRGVLKRECDFIDVIQQQRTGIARAALGHDDEMIDQLEGVDDRVDRYEQCCRHQQWKYDAPESIPAA